MDSDKPQKMPIATPPEKAPTQQETRPDGIVYDPAWKDDACDFAEIGRRRKEEQP